MAEKNANQVIYNGKTLIDLSGDSVTPETLAEGETAHDAAGNPIVGVGKKTSVLYTEQTLTEEQQTQARTNMNAASADDVQELAGKDDAIIAASDDGAIYTASVPWIKELTVGARFTMLPNKLSTTTNPKLNVNGLGDVYIRCMIGTNNSATTVGASAGWILANKPIEVTYNGTYWITNLQRTDANIIYGTVKIANGGTGASEASAALANLGGVPKSGATMEGALVAQANTNYTVPQVRNVFEVADGASLPTGSNGDICFVYTP